MKFKVGDKVVVKPGFDGWSVSPDMKALEGRVVTITEVDSANESYLVREDDGYNPWIDDFWERLASPKDIKEDNELEKQMKMESDAMIPWHEEDDLEPIEDPLVTKILERNNKPSIQEQLEENLLELFDEDDKVNSPSHYTRGDIEVIDIIKQLTQGYEPFEAYLVGNAIKYLARANFKENKQQDLEKAEWHINKLKGEQNK